MDVEKTTEKQPARAMPGDIIAKAEEYLPGFNAQEVDGQIMALVSGKIKKDERRLTISVYPEKIKLKVRRDDTVYGQVTKADKGRFSMKIGALVSRLDRSLVEVNEDASIRIQGSRDSTMSPVRVGDYVRARVIGTGRGIDVSIGGKELGVVKALCYNCRSPLVLKGRTLYCENCEHSETRKMSEDYGLVYIEGEKHEN